MKRVDYCRIRTLEQLRVERMRNKVLLAESRHRFCNDVGKIFSADKLLSLLLAGGEKEAQFRAVERHIMTQAGVTDISYIHNRDELAVDVMSGVMTDAEVLIKTDELVEYGAEKERLLKEKEKLEGEVARVEKKLSNSGFVSKAPEKVVQAEREKQAKYQLFL